MELTVISAGPECYAGRHEIATGQLVVGDAVRELAEPACITCTEAQGYRRGLRAWQKACPCCFSAAHPEGLPSIRSVPGEAGR